MLSKQLPYSTSLQPTAAAPLALAVHCSPNGVLDFYTGMGLTMREAVVLNAGGHSMGGADRNASGWDGEGLRRARQQQQQLVGCALMLRARTCLHQSPCSVWWRWCPASTELSFSCCCLYWRPGSFTSYGDCWPMPSNKHLLDLLRYGWTYEVVEETSRLQVSGLAWVGALCLRSGGGVAQGGCLGWCLEAQPCFISCPWADGLEGFATAMGSS